jgi:NitT/TauT family transport system substrate-binding protein
MATRRDTWGRREFLGGMAGTVGLLSLARRAGAEPPPETTTIRLVWDPEYPTICYAPQFVAGELLRGEGFTDVRYVKTIDGSEPKTMAADQVDLSGIFAGDVILAIEARQPVVVLGGLHLGCLELFGTDRVRNLRDLRGKTIAVTEVGVGEHTFLAAMLAYVGLDPRKDVRWAVHGPEESMPLLAEGKIDAFMTYPPFTQEARAKKVGHVVVNTVADRPWSQYFCCMLTARRDFARRNPVATKRAMRAFSKAYQICTLEPERTARFLVEKGYTTRYDYALQALKEIVYTKWREYDPENTLNFYALRMREAGLIKSTPKKIIADGADWRFLNELKRELKG